MAHLEVKGERRLAFFAVLITIAGSAGVGRALAATCDVPSFSHPTIASAANDPSCPVIDLTLLLYSAPLSIAPVYHESGITISHPTTLNGNGTTIDGGNSGHSIFSVNSSFTLNNVRMQNGKAPGGGGAIRNFSGSATIKDSVFYSNTAAFGGAVNDHEAESSVIERCTFAGNTATGAADGGGAVYIDAFSTAKIDWSVFNGNSTNSGGGAIFTAGGNGQAVTITNTVFNQNSASKFGGAINFDASHEHPERDLTGDTFTGNSASKGGAIYYANGNDHDPLLKVTGSNFSHNRSSGDGGALWL